MRSERVRHLGLTAKLTVPFVLILMAALAVVGTLAARSIRSGLTESLDVRSAILVDTLATALADPLSLGETDRIRQLLEKARKVDAEVVYAVLVDAKGGVVWSTDQGSTVPAPDPAVAQAKERVRHVVAGAQHLVEFAQPVSLQGLGRLGVVRLGVTTERVESSARRAAWTVAIVGACALIFGVGIYLGVARRVARPLNAAVIRLDELASGDADLTLRLQVATADEAGRLATSLNTFLEKQHTLVREIRSTAAHVGAASQQVASAASQLSGRAQDQAAALEESAASLEEITATVRQNAESARRANSLAVEARAAAEKGGTVVGAAVASMEEITKASRQIADIITVIDEIAFQTNLLALNAAVEAARAGEQGRGFAVVAAEVRNLAQRSAGAAREIKALIQDSVRKIAGGSELVNESGKTLSAIVAAVKDVATIVGDIAAASQEQSTGIGQVNHVVSRMDQAVQENASHTEELSGTARALQARAQQLEALVRRFRLREEAAAPVAAAESPTSVAQVSAPARAVTPLAGQSPRRPAPDAEPRRVELVPAGVSEEPLEEF